MRIDVLTSGEIYKGSKGTLASRIDFAWKFYTDEKYDAAYREGALKFLIYAFDINDPNDINGQLIRLMQEREAYKASNPEYIPGKSPSQIPFDPGLMVLKQSRYSGDTGNTTVDMAIKSKEILDVNKKSKELDRKENTTFYHPERRAFNRVDIRSGKLQKDGVNFDTSTMLSHEKRGFAAYTLNVNGELSVFNHRGMADRIAHSSMNAGAPVVAAGEIKVENGVLKSITTHSGHYQPTLFNVYRMIEHLAKNNVDISQAKIVTFQDPSKSLPNVHSAKVYYEAYQQIVFETPADQIYLTLKNIITENVNSISSSISNYQDGGLLSAAFKLKDKLLGTELTQKKI